jgi:uncharacterized protein
MSDDQTGQRHTTTLTWDDLGDVAAGRPNLGPNAPVEVYRLFEFSIREAIDRRLGGAVAADVLREAGAIAGAAFCDRFLDTALPFDAFAADVQRVLRELNVGVLRVESADRETNHLVLTIAEDLDCSGLPPSGDVVCEYDEGFLAGIFEAYTGTPFTAREVDCWASGGRVCRFAVHPASSS